MLLLMGVAWWGPRFHTTLLCCCLYNIAYTNHAQIISRATNR